jgi:hypothetical protein
MVFARTGERHVVILNPAASVKGVNEQVMEGKTPEITIDQVRALLNSVSPGVGRTGPWRIAAPAIRDFRGPAAATIAVPRPSPRRFKCRSRILDVDRSPKAEGNGAAGVGRYAPPRRPLKTHRN